MNRRVRVRFVRPVANGADTIRKPSRSILPLVCTAGIVAAILLAGVVSTASAAPPAIYNLGALGGDLSYGYSVNDAGQVAGWSYLPGNMVYHAFRYDGTPGAGGVMRDLGDLGGSESPGFAVNDAGQVAGYSEIPSNTGARAFRAFRYDGTPGSGGFMRDLGTLGGTASFGWAINDLGQVAGSSFIAGPLVQHAFRYDGTPGAGGQMIDLDVWLDANNPAEGAKWTLSQAFGLSNTGWVTGVGYYDPDGPEGVDLVERAFLLDASALVPEPSAAALALLGLSSTLLLLRHSSRRPNKSSR